MQFSKIGEEYSSQYIPPPLLVAVLPVNVQFSKVGEELYLQDIPPP